MEQLREKFGGIEICTTAVLGATTTASGPGIVKTLAVLATLSPPILQLGPPVAAAVAGAPAQVVVTEGFAIPSPPLQPVC